MKATFTTRGAEGWHAARGAQEVGGGPSIGRNMGWALAGPLSIGIVWGVDCLAKYWNNIWHLFVDP